MPPGVGCWRTLGNLLLMLLIFQFITRFALAMFYAPTPDHAHESMKYITENVPLGGVHSWVAPLGVFVRGGKEVGALTLTRFYAIHIMLLPVVLVLLTAAHPYLVRRLHIAGPVVPQKGTPQPLYPYQLFRDAVVVLVGMGLLVTCALLLKPPLYSVADPSGTAFTPRPEWYFLGLYELLKLMPPKLEILGTVVIPGLVATGSAAAVAGSRAITPSCIPQVGHRLPTRHRAGGGVPASAPVFLQDNVSPTANYPPLCARAEQSVQPFPLPR